MGHLPDKVWEEYQEGDPYPSPEIWVQELFSMRSRKDSDNESETEEDHRVLRQQSQSDGSPDPEPAAIISGLKSPQNQIDGQDPPELIENDNVQHPMRPQKQRGDQERKTRDHHGLESPTQTSADETGKDEGAGSEQRREKTDRANRIAKQAPSDPGDPTDPRTMIDISRREVIRASQEIEFVPVIPVTVVGEEVQQDLDPDQR